MKVLFVSSGTTQFGVVPFIKSQEESIKNNGVELDHFLIKENGIKGYVRSIGKLKKQLKSGGYQVIHAHYSYCGWVAVLAFSGLPIVVSYMGSDVYGMVDQKGNRKLKSYFVIFLAKLLQPFVSRIIVKSQNLQDYIFLKKKSRIIPNGVDYDKFKPRDKEKVRNELNVPQDKKVITFLGSPKDPRKNLKLLKEAVAYANEPDWMILNPYPVDPGQIPYYINAGDVLVLASYLEGSPNVIKEGMATSIPIVSTDVGDVKEIFGETQGCYLSKFDKADMADKLRKALSFENGKTTGREDIAHLEINQIAKTIISLYDELIKA